MSQQPPIQRPGGQSWNPPPGGQQPQGYYPPPSQPPPYGQPPQGFQQPTPYYPPQRWQPPPGPPMLPPKKRGLPAIAIVGIIIGGLFVLVLAIGIVGAAIGGSRSATAIPKGPSSQVITLSSTQAAPSVAPQFPTVTPITATSRPTTTVAIPAAAAIPTTPATATVAAQPLKLVASGFGQKGRDVGVGFVVQNPDPARTLVLSQYQIAAYDGAGIVLKTDSGYIEVALPGQSIGIGRSLFLAEGQTAT